MIYPWKPAKMSESSDLDSYSNSITGEGGAGKVSKNKNKMEELLYTHGEVARESHVIPHPDQGGDQMLVSIHFCHAGLLPAFGQLRFRRGGELHRTRGSFDDNGVGLLCRLLLMLHQLPVDGNGLGSKRRELFGTAVPVKGETETRVATIY